MQSIINVCAIRPNYPPAQTSKDLQIKSPIENELTFHCEGRVFNNKNVEHSNEMTNKTDKNKLKTGN